MNPHDITSPDESDNPQFKYFLISAKIIFYYAWKAFFIMRIARGNCCKNIFDTS